MDKTLNITNLFGWLFGLLVIAIGLLNIVLVHPVPGIAYFLISLVYLPPVTNFLKSRFRFSIPTLLKITLGVIVIFFTLGVSDLGDMIDKL